jgi:hypothetical protein
MSEPSNGAEHTATVTASLQKHTILLATSMGWWRGQCDIPGDLVQVVSKKGETVIEDGKTTKPRLVMMHDKYPIRRSTGEPWKKLFQDIDSERNAILHGLSVSFPIRGVRVIPLQHAALVYGRLHGLTIAQIDRLHADPDTTPERREHLAEMFADDNNRNQPTTAPAYDPRERHQSLAYRLDRLAVEFVKDYTDIVAQIGNQIGDASLRKFAVSKIPPAEQLRAKFYITSAQVRMTSGEVEVNNQLTPDDVRLLHTHIRETGARLADEALQTLLEQPRQELAQALTELENLVGRNGRVTVRSFAPVQAAIAKLRAFEFVASGELLSRLKDLEQCIGATDGEEGVRETARGIREDPSTAVAFRNQLNDIVTEVASASRTDEIIARFGRARGFN